MQTRLMRFWHQFLSWNDAVGWGTHASPVPSSPARRGLRAINSSRTIWGGVRWRNEWIGRPAQSSRPAACVPVPTASRRLIPTELSAGCPAIALSYGQPLSGLWCRGEDAHHELQSCASSVRLVAGGELSAPPVSRVCVLRTRAGVSGQDVGSRSGVFVSARRRPVLAPMPSTASERATDFQPRILSNDL